MCLTRPSPLSICFSVLEPCEHLKKWHSMVCPLYFFSPSRRPRPMAAYVRPKKALTPSPVGYPPLLVSRPPSSTPPLHPNCFRQSLSLFSSSPQDPACLPQSRLHFSVLAQLPSLPAAASAPRPPPPMRTVATVAAVVVCRRRCGCRRSQRLRGHMLPREVELGELVPVGTPTQPCTVAGGHRCGAVAG